MHANSPYLCDLLLDAVWDYHDTPPVKPDNTAPELWWLRALIIFSRVFLSQLPGPSEQPASAAACRRVLEPDILEVSHLCGCMYWEHVCAWLCLTSEDMIVSLKQNDILEEGWTIMHVNSHALTSVNSILLQHPVPYLDGNHGLSGLSICLLIQSQIQCT